MYRTIIKRAGNNPLTGKAQYKVVEWFPMYFFDKGGIVKGSFYGVVGECSLPTSKVYQVGAFINPRKALGI